MGLLPPLPPADLSARGLRFALCVSRFNGDTTEGLLAGATGTLIDRGVAAADLHTYRCAGTFELGALAAAVAHEGRIDGLLAFGCLIRGETDHYRVLADQITQALGGLALDCAVRQKPIAVAFGVLTCENQDQAVRRSSKGHGNKGSEAALACIEQVNAFRAIVRKG